MNSSASKSSHGSRVKIKQWNAVAVWKWIANDDSCGICRSMFDACCSECRMPGDDCPLVWGQCSHCFHIHCIERWINTQGQQKQCPMCRQQWQIKKDADEQSAPTVATTADQTANRPRPSAIAFHIPITPTTSS